MCRKENLANMNKHVGWNNHVGRTKPIIEMIIYSALTGQVEHIQKY